MTFIRKEKPNMTAICFYKTDHCSINDMDNTYGELLPGYML